MRKWDLTSGKCTMMFKGHSSDVYDCVFAPDNRHMLSVRHPQPPNAA